MNNFFKLIFLVISFILFNQITNSQAISKKKTIKVEGRIAAVDVLASLTNLTYAPQQQIFIVKVEKLIHGKEDSSYLKVVYNYYSNSSILLPDLLKGSDKKWKLELTRDSKCDGSLEKMSYSKLYYVDNLNEETITKFLEKTIEDSGKTAEELPGIGKVIRLKDTGGLSNIPPGENLPCYLLTSDGIKRVGKI